MRREKSLAVRFTANGDASSKLLNFELSVADVTCS